MYTGEEHRILIRNQYRIYWPLTDALAYYTEPLGHNQEHSFIFHN
jgi:hypothetical protein